MALRLLSRLALPAGARAGRRPRSGTPWRQASWCAVDVELTGLDPTQDEIVAIGAVPVQDGRVLLGRALYTLVRTDRRPDAGAVLVHKLRAADLAHAPPLAEAVDWLGEVMGGCVPVFHTAAVERVFLGRALAERGAKLPPAVDTEVLGRLWLRELGQSTPARLPLAHLAALVGAPAEAPHHALSDAITTACAFLALASHLDAARPQTVGTLLSSSASWPGARRLGPG